MDTNYAEAAELFAFSSLEEKDECLCCVFEC